MFSIIIGSFTAITRVFDQMAQEQVIKLFRAAQADPLLKQKLNSAPNEDAFVKMAAEYGYDFTVEEWKQVTRFSVEELEGKLSEIPGI